MSAARALALAAALTGAMMLTTTAGAIPPAVSVTGGPSGAVASSSATFEFSVDDDAAAVECSLDGSGFSGCGSGVSYSALADGSHTFTVRATNSGAEVGSDSRSWSVDTTGPSLSLADVVMNVDDVASAVVTFTASGSDPNGPVSVTCTPTSGSTFPLGTTPVSCTATDGLGNNSAGSFDVLVRDQTAPTVTTPADIVVSINGVTSVSVPFSVTSTAGTPSCAPSSGSSFPLGSTTVTCTAADPSGNTGSSSFAITVQDTTPPTLDLPATQTVSVNAAPTANVSYTVTASDGPSSIVPSCSPASGSSFGIGTTAVTCSATDAAGNTASGSFNVVVQDTTAPTVSITGGPTGTVASSTATIPFEANEGSFSCALDGGSFASCSSPATLSGLGDGSHTFQVRATDAAGNVGNASHSWAVDVSPPTFTAPTAIVVEANGPAGAKATYSVTAADNGAPLLPGAVTCAPASGSVFPLGVRSVGCTAADSLGNLGSVTFNVEVRDTTPPTLLAADITVASTSSLGIRRTDPAMVAFLGSLRGTDLVSPVEVSTEAPALFPVGVTPLLVRATDGAGNVTRRTVNVTVLRFGEKAPPPPDLDPPADVTRLRAVAADHAVTLSWVLPTATDLAAIEVRIADADGVGAGRVVSRTLLPSVTLRGLRNGVESRFVVVAIDQAGNESRGVVIVAVPAAKRLALPKAGTKVRTPPLLRWVPTPNASYYNVQLYRGKTKVLSAWPTRTRLQLSRTWMHDRARQKLTPGTYAWYVWPGFGARNLVTYGELIGKSTFVVLPPISTNG